MTSHSDAQRIIRLEGRVETMAGRLEECMTAVSALGEQLNTQGQIIGELRARLAALRPEKPSTHAA